MKISKLLPITLALLLGTSGVFAAQSKDQADYELQLNEYFNVVATAPAAAATVEYTGDYDGINVSTISGTYAVTSNTDTKSIFFYGTCLAGEAQVPALFGTDPKNPLLVFTNTEIGTVNNKALTSADIAAITAGSQEPTQSPNAIVLKLAISSELEEGSFPSGKKVSDPSFVESKNIQYDIPNSKVIFTCTTGGTAQNNSFSTLDTNGLYRATLYLSDAKQAI